MYTESELIDAIEELKQANHSIQNVSKLASIYTVLDHIGIDRGYSMEYKQPMMASGYDNRADNKADRIGRYGDSEFLKAVSGKRAEGVLLLVDELMYTLKIVDDALYNSVMCRLYDIT